jgi:hypothetical protein
MDAVWQRSISRWQKVLRMKRVWWNCCTEMDAAVAQVVQGGVGFGPSSAT